MIDTKQLQERLRKVITEIRRKPYPISDLIPLLSEAADALQASAQVQGEPSVDQLRELLSAHKLAAVPMRATHAMLDVMSDEDWQWADLLVAAEAITEDEYEWIERTSQPAQAKKD